MSRLWYLISILVITCRMCESLIPVYFWREYTGEVPNDAIIAGTDINGKNVYIGQAFVSDQGHLMVVQLSEGVTEGKTTIGGGVRVINKYLKILCGPQDQSYWMRTESKTLHLALTDKHAVIGGHELHLGDIGVGRISHDGEVKIGKVNLFSRLFNQDIGFYFEENGGERITDIYEVLMYNGSLPKKDIDV